MVCRLWLVALALGFSVRLAAGAERDGYELGYFLRRCPQVSIWWAEGTYKVFRETKLPTAKTDTIAISAACNEYEPFQLVLRPEQHIQEVSVQVDDFRSASGHVIPSANVEVSLVEYVKVENPTDSLGHVGMYPDPLSPVQGSIALTTGENQPLWFTAYVPPGTPAGVYQGAIRLTGCEADRAPSVQLRAPRNDTDARLPVSPAGGKLPAMGQWASADADVRLADAGAALQAVRLTDVEIPVVLEVFNFSLPKETHTETAYGVSLNARYHGLKTEDDKEKTFDLYMQNCAKHRISPYSPMQFHPIECRVDPNATDPQKRIRLDFSDFDKAAHRYLDEYAFTTFNFASIVSGFDISPRWSTPQEKELKKEVIRRVCQHLEEKGWLKKAYDYWIDEPPPEQYKEVLERMIFLKEADPRLRRLLTFCHDRAPLPFFYGGVNLWVPVLNLFNPERAREREAVGESVWWYVCCGPHHPYPNNFIDHPAINHRIRLWMIQKYHTDGSLYWSVTYWQQNPWKTAMSYSPQGGTWGNGDGRLLYPPSREPPEKPMVCGPVNSIRFEMLREGLEDQEYFWVLSRVIEELKKKNDPSLAEAVATGERAMGIVDSLVRTLTDFEKDPRKLYQAREELARTIVKLKSPD